MLGRVFCAQFEQGIVVGFNKKKEAALAPSDNVDSSPRRRVAASKTLGGQRVFECRFHLTLSLEGFPMRGDGLIEKISFWVSTLVVELASTHFLRAAKVLLTERAMRGQIHASRSETDRFATRLGRGVSKRPLHPTGEASKTKIAFSNNHIFSFSGLPFTDSGSHGSKRVQRGLWRELTSS